MTDNINKISSKVDGNVQQQTAASIVNLTDDDVIKIWDAVSAFIESYMKQFKGVIMPGFATFSFIHKRIDVGNNKFILLRRPVFALSEKIVQMHGLKLTRYPINGSIPVHPINYFYVQTQSVYSRDQIEQCVKHVLQVFNRSIAAQRNIEFTFTRIGKLHIRNGKVKMKFFKDFIQAVDENAGKYIIDNMCNRPNTCDSVMSERDAVRTPTSINVLLPRLSSRVGNSSMQAIQEENPNDDVDDVNNSRSEPIQKVKDDSNRSCSRSDDFKLPPIVETSGEPTASTTTPSHVVKTTGPGSSLEGVIPIAALFSSMDLIQPTSTGKRTPALHTPLKRTPPTNQTTQETEQAPTNPPKTHAATRPKTGSHSSLGLSRSVADFNNTRERISSSLNIYPQQYQQMVTKPMTSCGHYSTQQELCIACHQRAKRNIPVYINEEKRVREAEDERLLDEYLRVREAEEQKKREAAVKAAREERQRIDAFNLGIAQATRAKKLERPKTTDIPRSIIFRKRTKTPPVELRQKEFAKHLEAQIKFKQDEEQLEKIDKDFMERLEQIHLAESLAQERETYMKNKRRQQEELKNSLENQIRNKPPELPACEAEIPYFGLDDMASDKLKERRRRAIEIVRQQKDLIEQRQRQQLLKQVRDQEVEVKVLHKIKDDLVEENRERRRRDLLLRKDLELDWTEASIEKRKRDAEEKMFLKAPDGVLVHEQCDQYKRCAQCQRNLNNYGQNNFWKDTRYIPGTHIMV